MRNFRSLLMSAALLGATASVSGLLFVQGSVADPSTATPPASAASTTTDRCSALAGAHFDQVEITSATTQPANDPVPGASLPSMNGDPSGGPAVSGLPSFCRVTGSIHPTPASNIKFEVWMPSKGWDGRLAGASNGGSAGSIVYYDLAAAVRAGEAVLSTDTGHAGNGKDTAWAKGHPERVTDYGWRAVHLTTVLAKELVSSFYGHGPDHSYFYGCSNGGREALMEASRFPTDYDGVLAGAPAAVMTNLIMVEIGTVQAQSPPGAAIRPEQAKLLQSEVLRQCDARDGQVDGLVDDPRVCKIDTAKLACGADSSPQCFTPPQLAALRKIWAGPHTTKGQRVSYGFPPSGAEVGYPIAAFGWDGVILTVGAGKDIYQSLADGMMKDFPAKPIATSGTFDFNKDPAVVKAILSDGDAKPQLRAFFNRGGKLIMWHGWADPVIPPEGTLAFYQESLKRSGPHAKDSEVLFMVPDVQHCFGGTGADLFGQIGAPPPSDTPDRNIARALQAWVETGRKPESLIGRRGFAIMGPSTAPEKQRLICAYPQKAVLTANADPDQAASYSCQTVKAAR